MSSTKKGIIIAALIIAGLILIAVFFNLLGRPVNPALDKATAWDMVRELLRRYTVIIFFLLLLLITFGFALGTPESIGESWEILWGKGKREKPTAKYHNDDGKPVYNELEKQEYAIYDRTQTRWQSFIGVFVLCIIFTIITFIIITCNN